MLSRRLHRTARSRALARRFPRLFLLLGIVGPGLIAANAGNDAGGIATYSAAGARYGYQLLWVIIVILVALIVVQEMCARLGAVTGMGFSDLVREHFGVRMTSFVVLALLVANLGTAFSEFVGIGAAAELLHVPRLVADARRRRPALDARRLRLLQDRRARVPRDGARVRRLSDRRRAGASRLGRSRPRPRSSRRCRTSSSGRRA